ncbi:MAG TPA: hypothetical protein VI548_02800 [Chitinophagaceae bacterium]|nr:hypothetical protein [Chitinophagaceae bacterium]
MNSEFQKRLYEMEVLPPGQVWKKLSLQLDEINADNKIAGSIRNATFLPSPNAWEKILATLEVEEKPITKKKAVKINWKRLALAAVFSGMIISVWLIFFNPQRGNKEIVTTSGPAPVIHENKIVPENKELNKSDDMAEKKLQPAPSLLSANKKITIRNIADNNYTTIQPAVSVLKEGINAMTIKNEKPGNKVFNQPIDDLSMIAANDNYMTMVTTDGRIVKIPAHLAHLAPLLQNKPITEDYYELMFGEKAFWKEKMSDWRQQLATSPVSSGDLFSNMVELLKTVESK